MPTGKIFTYKTVIFENYLDTFGHVNNAVYFILFEQARWELITANGYGIDKIKETGIGPTILAIETRFMRELKARDEIIIQSQTLSYEKKISKIEQKILRNGEICCVAVFTMALFDLKLRKLILPTPEWLRGIGWQTN